MVEDDGGPAFPFKVQGATTAPEAYYGMSLRDYFAAKAMQGMLSSCDTATQGLAEIIKEQGLEPATAIARFSYAYADAMLEERSKP